MPCSAHRSLLQVLPPSLYPSSCVGMFLWGGDVCSCNAVCEEQSHAEPRCCTPVLQDGTPANLRPCPPLPLPLPPSSKHPSPHTDAVSPPAPPVDSEQYLSHRYISRSFRSDKLFAAQQLYRELFSDKKKTKQTCCCCI